MVEQLTEAGQSFPDYYQILHLHADADAAMVDQAYWHLARLYNSSIRADSEAGERLDELNEAYSVLRSPELRKEYDQARNTLLDKDGTLVRTGPDQEAPPLAVMAKQRPKPRKEPKEPEKAKRRWLPLMRLPSLSLPRVQVQQLSIPPWQSAVGALTIVVLAGAALVTGTSPVLVAALLIIGLAVTTLPLARKLPRFPELPISTLRLPTVRAPRLPERPDRLGVDADMLRRSTEAMRARWRVGTEGISTSFTPLSADLPEEPDVAAAESSPADEPQDEEQTSAT